MTNSSFSIITTRAARVIMMVAIDHQACLLAGWSSWEVQFFHRTHVFSIGHDMWSLPDRIFLAIHLFFLPLLPPTLSSFTLLCGHVWCCFGPIIVDLKVLLTIEGASTPSKTISKDSSTGSFSAVITDINIQGVSNPHKRHMLSHKRSRNLAVSHLLIQML